MKFKLRHNRIRNRSRMLVPFTKEGNMFRVVVIAASLVLATQFAIAEDAPKLVGTWKLISVETQFKDGSPSSHVYGPRPSGYATFTEEGRMTAVIEAEGRKPPQTDEDRAALLRSMWAVAGTYRLEGNTYIARVDVSWNPALNGKEHVRFYRFDGDRLEVTTAWAPSPNIKGAPIVRGVSVWERVK